ncbi:hypothetical protein [uncultured Clostridium sp.]|uniref:hypothetical protein n=1 Tax=uncultured Clostridium sp. TaxID=59620 RepID=UPI00262FA8FB|nr:hypothetical protein [uncultured Clostridium sp.]
MNRIYIILEDNGYDGLKDPDDHYYTSEEEAEKECKKLNGKYNSKRDYYHVHEMTLKTD